MILTLVLHMSYSTVAAFEVDRDNSGSIDCVFKYHDLEESLLSNEVNLDSLTRTFLPPNEPRLPVTEVYYYLNDSGMMKHPVTLEMEGVSADELDDMATYRFRWSQTPVYLFVDPFLIEALSLYSVQIRKHAARLVLSPICSNYSVGGIPLPEFHLNQMTTLVSHSMILVLPRMVSTYMKGSIANSRSIKKVGTCSEEYILANPISP